MPAPKRGVLRGKKFSNKHSTLIAAVLPVVKAAKEMSEVTKIVLGKITRVRSSKFRVIAKQIRAGLKVTVRGANVVQELFVYTSDPEKVKKRLESL